MIIKGVKAKITPFSSLYDFVNSTIDKDEHAIDHYKIEEKFEYFIEISSIEFLENLSNNDLAAILKNRIFESKVRDILKIRTEILEGLEDTEVLNSKEIGNNDVYVSYSYNLRIVVMDIDIPKTDYYTNKSEIDALFNEVEIFDDVAICKALIRPYFEVSFIYNERNDELTNYEVENFLCKR